jgi:hypothetical protein
MAQPAAEDLQLGFDSYTFPLPHQETGMATTTSLGAPTEAAAALLSEIPSRPVVTPGEGPVAEPVETRHTRC